MSRIHAAWRASTETIAHAAAEPLGREVRDLTVQRRDARVLEGDRLRDERAVVGERVADVEQRGGGRRGRAERGLEGGDVVALVDQRGGGELGELTAQGSARTARS